MGVLTKPKFGCTKHPVDDVIGTTNAIVDQVRPAVGTRDKQRRCFALGEARRHLNIDLVTVVERAQRTPGRIIPLDAVAEVQIIQPHAAIGDPFFVLLRRLILLVKRDQTIRRIGPGNRGHVGLLGRDKLEVIGARSVRTTRLV